MLKFLEDNYIKIITVVVLLSLSYLVFAITTRSVRKLKTEIFSSYPFDIFFPQGGAWSIGYFLLVILLLGLLVFFMLKGNFFLQPA